MYSSIRSICNLAALVVFITPSWALPPSDVHVVDNSNSVGTDFTSIASALAASADGDILLIRSGTYAEFLQVNGKGVTFQAEEGATVLCSQGLQILNTAPAQVVSLKGIDVSAIQAGSSLEILSCQGPVWIEDATFTGTATGIPFPGGGIRVCNSDSVVLSGCTLGTFSNQFNDPGISALNSHVSLFNSSVQGPEGFSAGGFAVQADASEMLLSNSTLTGGAGNDYAGPPASCSNGGAGGTGLVLQNGASVEVFGGSIQGGAGGTTNGTCTNGQAGDPSSVDSTSSLSTQAIDLGSLVETSPVRERENFMLTLNGEAGSFAWSLYNFSPQASLTSGLFDGELLVATSPFLFVAFGILPASGSLSMDLSAGTLALGTEGSVFYSQVLTLSSTDQRLRLGSPSLLTILDGSF